MYSRKDGGQRGCRRRVREGGRWWVREVVGPGGKRKGRSQSEKELMEPVAAGFRS